MRILLLTAGLLAAQVGHTVAQQPDTAYQAKIKQFTTDPRFLPASVLNIVDHPDMPSKLKHFGHIIGAPSIMHRTAEIFGYYKTLDDASPRVSMQQVGTTEEGRTLHTVTISSEENMKRLDHYKAQ